MLRSSAGLLLEADSIRNDRAEDMRDLRCMSFTSKATSEILVAGMQDTMLVIDTNKGEIVKRVCLDSIHSSLHQVLF